MNKTINSIIKIGIGLSVGAGLMYLLDPDKGGSRRALLVDQAKGLNRVGNAINETTHNITTRTKEVLTKATSKLSLTKKSVPDDLLEKRVRAKMGHVVSHTSAIEVVAHNGEITLYGPILKEEVARLISTVNAVKGVTCVEDQLDIYESAEGIPELQGGIIRTPKNNAQQNDQTKPSGLSPSTRAITGIVGGGLSLYGVTHRGIVGKLASVLGFGLLTTSVTNLEFKRLKKFGSSEDVIDITKSMLIHAPVEQVYEFWHDFENFPEFMNYVKEIKVEGDVSHWVVEGPGGVPVSWDAVTYKDVPNRLIAWKSLPGSTIPNAGRVTFIDNGDNSTTVQLKISYNPPAGELGLMVAKVFGADPKSEIDEDLKQLKSFFEPVDNATTDEEAHEEPKNNENNESVERTDGVALDQEASDATEGASNEGASNPKKQGAKA